MIHDLKRQGLGISAITRRTGLDRKTVRKYLDPGLQSARYGPRQPRPRLLDPYGDYLRDRLTDHAGLSGRRLMREIADLGYAGGYTAVTDFLREVRPPPQAGFERRFETPPGKQAQVDFAHFKAVFDDEPGHVRTVWLFSMVLGHSGVPAEILYDRMKTAVVGEEPDGSGRDAAASPGGGCVVTGCGSGCSRPPGGAVRWLGSSRRRFLPSRTGCAAIRAPSSKMRTWPGSVCAPRAWRTARRLRRWAPRRYGRSGREDNSAAARFAAMACLGGRAYRACPGFRMGGSAAWASRAPDCDWPLHIHGFRGLATSAGGIRGWNYHVN